MTKESWSPPEGYYQEIAEKDVNGALHLACRTAVSAFTIVRFGRPVIDTTEAFDEARASFSDGNILTVSAHRDELDTLFLPSALERVGIHHSRPIAKDDIFNFHSIVRGAVHELGAYCHYRPKPDLEGLSYATTRILERGQNVTDYLEATRVRKDVLKIKKFGKSIAYFAAANDSLIVPVGIAGLSTEYSGEKPDWVKEARDKRSYFGIGPRLVFAFGDPFKLGPLPEFKVEEDGSMSRADLAALNHEARARSKRVHTAMQVAQDRAYEVRGSSLEEKYTH